MAFSLFKNVVLALLLTSVTTVYAGACKNPRVRREWRALSEGERQEWIRAVKVGSKSPGVASTAVTDSVV